MSFKDSGRQEPERSERARLAQATAAQAYARLLALAEGMQTDRARRVAQFLASMTHCARCGVDIRGCWLID